MRDRKYVYVIEYWFSEDYYSNGDKRAEYFDDETKFKSRLNYLRLNKDNGYVDNITLYYGELFKGKDY